LDLTRCRVDKTPYRRDHVGPGPPAQVGLDALVHGALALGVQSYQQTAEILVEDPTLEQATGKARTAKMLLARVLAAGERERCDGYLGRQVRPHHSFGPGRAIDGRTRPLQMLLGEPCQMNRICRHRHMIAADMVRRVASTLVTTLIAVAVAFPAAATAANEGLQRAKLKAEVAKLKAETEKAEHDDGAWVRGLGLSVPLVTALIAAVGLVLTAKKAVAEAKEQRLSREQTQRLADTQRFDDRFAAAVAGAASDKVAERRASAVVIESLIRETEVQDSEQAINLLLALMQADEPDDVTARVRGRALERLIKERAGTSARELDLKHVRARGVNLGGVDLTGVEFGFAHLEGAFLDRIELERSKGYGLVLDGASVKNAKLGLIEWASAQAVGTHFDGSRLTGAKLRRADLRGADFYRCRLTNADLSEADLRDTLFNDATLTGADFHRAIFNETALRSLLRARDWPKAQFDGEVRRRLQAMTGGT